MFIFGLHMGVKGAAVATVISQGLSAVWVLSFLPGRKSSLKIRESCIRLEGRILKSVFSLGISPIIINVTESFISIVLNHGLQTYGGNMYVGFLIIMQLFSAPINGFTQGMTPIVSYHYGAQKFDRVKKLILLIPLAVILPRFVGVMGVCYAEPISDALSVTVATLLFAVNIR